MFKFHDNPTVNEFGIVVLLYVEKKEGFEIK